MSSVNADDISAQGDKPFFVYLSTNAPHGPFLVADKWKQPYLDAGVRGKKAAFMGMVANFDWNVGRLMTYLKRTHLDENTIVIYLTDNGTGGGTTFGPGRRIRGWPLDPRENANMRGGKSSAYDGGHRVPLFIQAPDDRLGKPRDITTLAMHFDLTPTLMELCRLKRPAAWPALDGRSLLGQLAAEPSDWRPRVLHTQMHGGNGYVKPGDPWEVGVAMTKRWRLVEGRELYDIGLDPMQRKNVAERFPAVFESLTKAHLTWFESIRKDLTPTRILVGGALQNPSSLTSQDWAMPKGGPPWAHSHVVRRSIANGPWMLDVAKEGTYRFTLSRWPLYIHKPIDSTRAKILVQGQTESVAIKDPGKASFVAFELELRAGPATLKTWLTTPRGKSHGAYFVSVERL